MRETVDPSIGWKAKGFTLLELMVVMAIMGVVLLVSSLSLASEFGGGQDETTWEARLVQGRRQSVEEGVPVVVTADSAHLVSPVLFLPDGRVIGSGVDPLTGRPENAP